MMDQLKEIIEEIRARLTALERHAGILPGPWIYDLVEKTVVPKKPGKK
jgi:hypothetical protein